MLTHLYLFDRWATIVITLCVTVCRYIEGLTSGSRNIGGWDKSLYAKPPENPSSVPVTDKLPVHWLGDGNQENAVSALWELRDHMLRDALTISRALDST